MVNEATDLEHNHIHISRKVAEAWEMNAIVWDVNSLETLGIFTESRIVQWSVHSQDKLVAHLRNSLAKTLVVMPGFNQILEQT